jgi:ATP-dependent helicase/nuclease subunit B
LEALLQVHLTAVGFRSGQLQADGARLRAAARAYADWSAAQRQAGARTIVERSGRLSLANGIVLTCLADRIDLFGVGAAQIVDVKSGTPPTADQLKASFSPQLLLEAAILAAGGFDDVPPTDVDALVYWHFSGSKPEAKVLEVKDCSVSELAVRSVAKLEETLAAYNEAGHPMRHKPRVFFVKPWTDYDHLARRKEWAAEGAE